MQISPSLCADCGIGRDHHRTRPGEQEAAADGKRGWRVFPRGEFPLWSSGPKSGSNHPFRPGGRRHSKCGGSAVERTFRCLSRCKSPLCPFLLRRRSAACPPHGAGGRSGLSALQGVREREVPTGRVSGQSRHRTGRRLRTQIAGGLLSRRLTATGIKHTRLLPGDWVTADRLLGTSRGVPVAKTHSEPVNVVFEGLGMQDPCQPVLPGREGHLKR